MSGTYCIFLKDQEIQARIGIHDFEREGPQRLQLNIVVAMRRKAAGDHIANVIDYDFVRQEAAALAHQGHFELQESFCEALLERLRSRPGVIGLIVASQKPDVYPDCRAVGCLMSWIDGANRDDVARLFSMIQI